MHSLVVKLKWFCENARSYNKICRPESLYLSPLELPNSRNWWFVHVPGRKMLCGSPCPCLLVFCFCSFFVPSFLSLEQAGIENFIQKCECKLSPRSLGTAHWDIPPLHWFWKFLHYQWFKIEPCRRRSCTYNCHIVWTKCTCGTSDCVHKQTDSSNHVTHCYYSDYTRVLW